MSPKIAAACNSNWRFSGQSSEELSDTYVQRWTLWIAAGIKKVDEQGGVYYVVENNDSVELKILRTWIETLEGDTTTFSLSPADCQTERTNFDADDVTIPIYSKPGYAGTMRIWAEVEVTIDGITETVQVSKVCFVSRVTIVTETRPDDDTVEKLNAYLAELAENAEDDFIYTVNLAAKEYDGVIKTAENSV